MNVYSHRGSGLAIFLLLVAAGVWHLGRVPAAQPGGGLPPETYSVPGNPYFRGLDLIFFADGHPSRNEFDADVHLLLDELRGYEPWKSFERYNVYRIFPSENDICLLKTEDERHPVLRCDPEKVNSYLHGIPSDRFRVVFVSRRQFESWANVSRGDQGTVHMSVPGPRPDPATRAVLGIQFAHLMGHAFGLKDEELFMIAKAGSAGTVPDGPNCAPDRAAAEELWGDLVGLDRRVGYFQGCVGKEEYVKPTDSSLMNLNELGKLVPDYGPVSERYLRRVLDTCFSEIPPPASENADFLERYPEFAECYN